MDPILGLQLTVDLLSLWQLTCVRQHEIETSAFVSVFPDLMRGVLPGT